MNALTTSSTSTPEITRLVDGLAPVENDTIAKSIHWLIKSGMSLPGAITADTFRQVYGMALAARATAAVKIVTEKLTRGEYGEEYTRFIPTPAMFSALAAVEQNRIVADLARAKAIEAAKQSGEVAKKDPESIARVRKLRQLFKVRTAAMYRPADPAPVDDPERREYFAQIAALPDRGAITAEEQQFRNRNIGNR